MGWCVGLRACLVLRYGGYTKSIEMLVYSLALVCWRQWMKSNITTH